MDKNAANALMTWINNYSVGSETEYNPDSVDIKISISTRDQDAYISPGEIWWEASMWIDGIEVSHTWLGRVSNTLTYENGEWVEAKPY